MGEAYQSAYTTSSFSFCGRIRYGLPSPLAFIGIPSESTTAFLGRFCGVNGYLTIVVQVGGCFMALFAWIAWVRCLGASPRKHEHLTRVVWATTVAAALSLATYVLWVSAFATFDNITLGSSAYCTIVSVGVLVVAAVVARCALTEEAQPGAKPSQHEPLV